MLKFPPLPKTATAPFCPSEVRGTVALVQDVPFWKKLRRFAGPGLMIAVGYMDPGNWATDIQAGSQYGFQLLFVVLFSGLAAIVLQELALRLGIVTGRDLAQLTHDHTTGVLRAALWVAAEISIVATDLAEVLGCALALKLLFGLPLGWGVGLTACDTLLVLGLQGRGIRRVEAIILALVLSIALCFVVQLSLVTLDWHAIALGFVPRPSALGSHDALYAALGILGATVMPHNLYLHSSLIQTRSVGREVAALRDGLRLARADTVIALLLAIVVNAAILILAGAGFHESGHRNVSGIEDAYELLAPVTGVALAPILFGLGLFASGQSSTFTGTIAGQVLFEGFLERKIPCFQLRLITRGLALVPAWAGLAYWGEHAVGNMLVWSQVVLSLQLPFAMYPLIRFTSNSRIMGVFATRRPARLVSWGLFIAITAANLWLIVELCIS
jgi:manganese transport protein